MVRNFALAAVILAAGHAAQADAAVVNLDFHLAATDFSQIYGSAASAPFASLSGDYSISFDNHASFDATSTGVAVTNLTFPGSTSIAYDASSDLLTVGTQPRPDGYSLNSGQYGFYVMGASTANPSALLLQYAQDGSAWQSSSVTLSSLPGAVPEPASWAMMVGGFGLLGGAMRRRQRVSASFA